MFLHNAAERCSKVDNTIMALGKEKDPYTLIEAADSTAMKLTVFHSPSMSPEEKIEKAQRIIFRSLPFLQLVAYAVGVTIKFLLEHFR